MKYTKEERIDIGRRIYDEEVSAETASQQFNISRTTAWNYMRLYQNINHLPDKDFLNSIAIKNTLKNNFGLQELETLSKEELILEVVKALIAQERLKKGYEMKGDGSVIRYGKKNSR